MKQLKVVKRAHTLAHSNSMLSQLQELNWINSNWDKVHSSKSRQVHALISHNHAFTIKHDLLNTTRTNSNYQLQWPTTTDWTEHLSKWKKSISVDNKHTHYIHCKTTRIVFSLFTLMFKYDYLPKRKDEVTNTKTKYQLPAAMADDDWLNWNSGLWATTTTSTADMLRCQFCHKTFFCKINFYD